MRQHYLVPTGIFFLSLFLFTWGMSAQEITSFDSRFYLFAKEMWHNGLSWFPTTYGQPYPDYPVTSTLLIYSMAKLVGGLNKLVAVLPSAIAAAWTVVLTYRIGHLHDRRWGLAAVCFTLMTLMFLKCARSISLDMYPTMISAWCFYIAYAADIKRSPLFSAKVLFGCLYLLLVFSFAFRGPIGLVMPAGVVCSYYFLAGQWKKLMVFGVGALGVLVACTAVLFYIAYCAGGDVFLRDVIRMEVAGRIDNTFQPIYFYFSNSLGNYALSYPLAWLVLIVMAIKGDVVRCARTAEVSLMLKLAGWALIILIGMSIPGDKKARYVLPMVPAIALIAAYPIAKKMRGTGVLVGLFLMMLILDTVYIKVVEPYLLDYDKTKAFVTEIETLRAKAHADLVFYREQPDGTPIKYQVYNQQNDHPVFIETPEQLLHYQQSAFFIASENYYSQLSPGVKSHFSVVARGKVGHVMMVVFKAVGG